MNRWSAAAALLLGLAPAALNGAVNEPVKGEIITATELEASGKVVDVNRFRRVVTIRDESGTKLKMKVPPEVFDLDKLTKGSRVKLRYSQAVALAIAKPTTPSERGLEDMRLAPREDTGGETVAASWHATGRIEDIDREKREMKIKTPDGETLELQVPAETPGFNEARIGDSTLIHYTEAVTIELEKSFSERKMPAIK